MSETLAEEEKQRIRVELLTEIAKNEQDLEQCNKETGRYGREFLYNIRDLEQLCTITECPLTSHELKEFGIFPKKKNLLNRAWTHVKDIVTKPHKAEEEAARIAREKAEIEDRMNRLEEHSRRSEEARIERDRIVKEQTERQIRENAAHLEKEKTEKEELKARIKMMEEQMRRSEEARLELERRIEKEKERKIKEEEERRIREEEARIEREKAEAEERERKEKERIEKEEEDRKRKVVEEREKKIEERRLRIEFDVKFLLALPYELRKEAYRDYNLEKRRELRIYKTIAEIELETEYFCEQLWIERKEDHVELRYLKCCEIDTLSIPISELEKELEIMGKNTQFDRIEFWAKSGDRQIINGVKSLKVKQIIVNTDSNLNDADLRSLAGGNIYPDIREQIAIRPGSSVTVNGLMWIYEKMRDRHVSLNWAWIDINETERWKFLDNFGNFNRESLTFIGTNHNQEVRHDDEDVIIEQDILRIRVGKKDGYDKIGRIWFHFNS